MTHIKTDYRDAALALQPHGPAWNRNIDSMVAQWWTAVGEIMARVEQDADGLGAELTPSTTDQLLPDWERDFGLPDPYNDYTVAARRAALLAKMKKKQIPTVDFIKQFAATLGYDVIVVMTHRPFRCGVFWSQCGNGIHECGANSSSMSITVIHSDGAVPFDYFQRLLEGIIPAHIEIKHFIGG